MADTVADSSSTPSVRITVDSENGDRLENGSEEIDNENNANNSSPKVEEGKETSEKSKDAKPCLFLRPSALSGDLLKSSSPSPSTASTPKLNLSSNKFACVDVSPESLFSFPSSSEKKDTKPESLFSFPSNSDNESKPTLPSPSPLSNPDYVFGQNLHNRVLDRVEPVSSNGTGVMLFSSVVKAETSNEEPRDKEDKDGKESTASLAEDAAKCLEQRAAKRKYDQVQVTTGEEDEKNVLQVTVKLFAFENGAWVERGRGTLRLNDGSNESNSSRIVVRTLGNLRVVLNTKIWAGMELSRAGEKSIRTTAMDANGHLKIFLIQGNPTEMNTLYSNIERRLRRCQAETTHKDNEESNPTPAKTQAIQT